MSMLLRKLVFGSAVIVFATAGQAQNVPAGSAPSPADQPAAAPAAPAAPSSGTSGTAGATAPATTEVLVVPAAPVVQMESHASNPATDGSNDPLIQHRKAKYRAKMEYKERMKAAKSDYKQEKGAAKAEYKADKREADEALHGASPPSSGH